MKFWLWAYFWSSLACRKPLFKILFFKGGSPYGPVLKIDPFSVVHHNLCHLRAYVHDILALGQFSGAGGATRAGR